VDAAVCPTAKSTGAAKPTAACNCGTEALVAVTTDQYCQVKTGVTTGRMNTKAPCTVNTAAAPAAAATAAGGCFCGDDLVDVAENKYCIIKANGNGVQVDNPVCPTAGNKANGRVAVGTACNCGTEASVPIGTTEFCYATNGQTGLKQTVKQCSGFNANQADGTTIAAQACSCGTASATTCDFCFETANAVASAAWAACPVTDGTAPFALEPNKCKCGTGSVDYGEYCLIGLNGKLSACANNDGTVLNGATQCACINSGTGVATVTAATNGLCNAGVSSTKAACTSTDGSAANTAPCTCGTATCTTGQKCTASTNTCATPPAPAPSPGTPAPPPTTITQKITFSGTQATYTGTLKTFSEQAYGKAIGIFDTTTTPPAYKTGCSVASVASASRRTSYAVTFTATVASAQASAANTASTALTPTSFATAATAVKAANTAYATVTAPTATAVAAPTATTPTVSGASAVTTSIMAMAVAVLAAFQARQ